MAGLVFGGGVYTAYVFTQAPTKYEVVDSQVALVVSERAFLELYIPHQEAATAAAQIVLEKGTRLRPLHDIAAKVAEEKRTESEYLKEQYQALYGVSYAPTGVYRSTLRALGELSTVELERAFLEDMIRHHEISIELAERGVSLSMKKEVAELVEKSMAEARVEILSLNEVRKLLPQ